MFGDGVTGQHAHHIAVAHAINNPADATSGRWAFPLRLGDLNARAVQLRQVSGVRGDSIFLHSGVGAK